MKLLTNFKNYDLAVEGSPTRQILISPLIFIPSRVFLFTPPNNIKIIPFFTSIFSNTEGAINLATLLKRSG